MLKIVCFFTSTAAKVGKTSFLTRVVRIELGHLEGKRRRSNEEGGGGDGEKKGAAQSRSFLFFSLPPRSAHEVDVCRLFRPASHAVLAQSADASTHNSHAAVDHWLSCSSYQVLDLMEGTDTVEARVTLLTGEVNNAVEAGQHREREQQEVSGELVEHQLGSKAKLLALHGRAVRAEA